MEYQDYYKTLGVSRDAQQDEIRPAYHKLARKYHPDHNKSGGAEAKFKEVGEAYEVLRDAEKRALYDQLGPNWKAGQNFQPSPDWDGSFQFRTGFDGEGTHFSDFFKSLFGGSGLSQHAPRAQTEAADLSLALEQLHREEPIELSLATPGTAIAHKRLKVRVPKGLGDGDTFRLRSQGSDGRDLHLTLRVKPHPRFRLSSGNLESEVRIAPWEAVLGAKVDAPTLDGAVRITVPPGTQDGTRIRLRGKGLRGSDQLVTFRIAVPKQVSERERALYEELANSSGFVPER